MIVKSKDMIGVRMGEKNRINPIHRKAQCLFTKIGWRIHQYSRLAGRNINTGAPPTITGIARRTNGALTTNHWHPYRRAGS